MEGPLSLEHGYSFIARIEKQRALLGEAKCDKMKEQKKIQHHLKKGKYTWFSGQWDRLNADGYS